MTTATLKTEPLLEGPSQASSGDTGPPFNMQPKHRLGWAGRDSDS